MKDIVIKNFKAFGDETVKIGGTTKQGVPLNVLCYGENGSGKSSVFEAMKFAFHYERIKRTRNLHHLTGEELANALRQIQLDFGHKNAGADFEIAVNNRSYLHFNASQYHAYMICGDDLESRNQIDVKEILKKAWLGHHDIDAEFTDAHMDVVVDDVNQFLGDFFFESIRVSRSQNGTFLLKIEDSTKGLDQDDDLKMWFNEAKIHLVILLAMLGSVLLMAPKGENEKRLLVLDDFITSLDMANRTFLYQCIVSRFKDFQVMIFTHNTSFYNLCDHLISEDKDQKDKWLRQGVFEYNNKHVVYSLDKSDTIKKLEQRLHDHPNDVHNIGNDVRQYFEVLLHRLAMLLMAGAKEETTGILAEISKKLDRRVFKVTGEKVYYMHDLVNSLMNVVANTQEDRQLMVIKKKLKEYSGKQDTDKLAENIQSMVIYQKVALHQSSHGHAGLPDLSAKEIKASLTLMKKIESTIEKLKIERI